MTCGVYKIEATSGKKYIGSSNNIERRWRKHKSELRAANHHCPGLQGAYNKYGETLHFEILSVFEKSMLLRVEQFCLDWFGHKHLYNLSN